MSTTREVIEFARKNGGVFTSQEAAALGMNASTLSRRVDDGIFTRVGRGVLTLPGTSTRADLMMRAACRSLGAVVSHESAAKLLGMGPVIETEPTVTVSHRSTYRFPGVRVHQSTDLMEAHLTRTADLRATNAERTIIDLSQTTGQRRLERIIDTSLANGKADLDRLVKLHTALARRGKPGVRRLRGILESRVGAPMVKDSELEAVLRKLLGDAGLPQAVREFHAPWLKPIDGRVDFAYPDERLILEADSRRWHALHDAFEVDRRRDNAAQLAGWRVLRFTWRMITDEPWVVVATVREALQRSEV